MRLKLLLSLVLISGLGMLNVSLGQGKGYQLPGWAMGGFIRPVGVNPVISPNPASTFDCPMAKHSWKWEDSDTFNPAATLKDGKIVVLYRAEDNTATGIGMRTSRIGYASSSDGLSMTRLPHPVLYPDNDNAKEFEWTGGCEDPRVAVTEDGLYVMFYTAWNRQVPRLSVATSKDLTHWQKHGPAFYKAYKGRFKDLASKSASIVTSVKKGKQVITKIEGHYLMYWGENAVCAAVSDDLTNWEPVLNDKNELKELIRPRDKFFDSALTECGPPAIKTDKGILLLYNGKNSKDENRDKRFTAGAYCAGQVLFDLKHPYEPIARLDLPFFRPMADYEKSGQYIDGTVFIEGMALFHNKWFLYYGCADSQVGVAVFDPSLPALSDPIPDTNQN